MTPERSARRLLCVPQRIVAFATGIRVGTGLPWEMVSAVVHHCGLGRWDPDDLHMASAFWTSDHVDHDDMPTVREALIAAGIPVKDNGMAS